MVGKMKGSSMAQVAALSREQAPRQLPQEGQPQEIRHVQLDALVVMKLLKHCGESHLVNGQILGLCRDHTLEVTNSFPFPPRTADSGEDEDSAAQYIADMMRQLRVVNIDHMHVGWYQSSYFGAFANAHFVNTQFSYQSVMEECVVLVVDSMRGSSGSNPFRALRLTPAFMDLYREQKFTADHLYRAQMGADNVFMELPVTIHVSPMANALLHDISQDEGLAGSGPGAVELELSGPGMLEKTMHMMNTGLDDLTYEQSGYLYYQRQMARQNQNLQAELAKRRAENEARIQAGEPPLPEEELENNPAYKLPEKLSRLDSLLLLAQVDAYSRQARELATESIAKLYTVSSLQ